MPMRNLSTNRMEDNIRLVLLDCFGTLIVAPSPPARYADIARGFNIQPDDQAQLDERFKEAMKIFKANSNPSSASYKPPDARWTAVIQMVLPQLHCLQPGHKQEVTNAIIDRFAHGSAYTCSTSIVDFLAHVKSHNAASSPITVRIATNSDERVLGVLSSFGLDETILPGLSHFRSNDIHSASPQKRRRPADFGHLVSHDLGVSKPDVAFFSKALELNGIPANEAHTALFVGDSIDEDVIPALKAGMRAVWVDRSPALDSRDGKTSRLWEQAKREGAARIRNLCLLEKLLHPTQTWDDKVEEVHKMMERDDIEADL